MLGHGIENIVDEYLYVVGQKHDTRWRTYLKKGFKRPSVLFSLNRIASLVKEAEVNLLHLFQAKDRWVSMVGEGNTSDSSYIVERSQHQASISHSLGEEDLVGFDENRGKLEQWLTGYDMDRSVIALHGMGGLGKAALAANIYRKEKKKFECHAWVSISQTYSIKHVLKCLITELVGSILEVAEDYLKQLVRRNMLQFVGKNSFGRMKKFKMHDILRGLAVDMCQKDCFGVTYEEGKCLDFLEKDGRRLVVHKLTKDIKLSFSSMHYLRSVITLDSTMPPFTLLPLIAEKSRYISVLELSGLPSEKIPDATGDLFHLCHLGLRYTKVKLLPKSIEKLSNLLTLDLGKTSIQELPRGIVKLKKLRHLFAEKLIDPSGKDFWWGIGVHFPNGLGNLINLQTLQALEAQDDSVKNWAHLHVGACDEKEVLRLNTLPTKPAKAKFDRTFGEWHVGRVYSPPSRGTELVFVESPLVAAERRPPAIPFSICKFDGA